MYLLRPLKAQDNATIAQIIRTVSQEFGLASDAGFAVSDPVLDDLCQVYRQSDACYWVVTDSKGHVFGGGGIAPLQGGSSVLEIQKMYFLPEIRGQGLAKTLLEHCFHFARQHGYPTVYLETTSALYQAVQLYEELGFIRLEQPLGNTGHSGACELWMSRKIF